MKKSVHYTIPLRGVQDNKRMHVLREYNSKKYDAFDRSVPKRESRSNSYREGN